MTCSLLRGKITNVTDVFRIDCNSTRTCSLAIQRLQRVTTGQIDSCVTLTETKSQVCSALRNRRLSTFLPKSSQLQDHKQRVW